MKPVKKTISYSDSYYLKFFFFQLRFALSVTGVAVMITPLSATLSDVVDILLEDENIEANETANENATILDLRNSNINEVKETVQELPNTLMQAHFILVDIFFGIGNDRSFKETKTCAPTNHKLMNLSH